MRASQRAQVERHMKRCGGARDCAAEVAVWPPLPGAAPPSFIENRSKFRWQKCLLAQYSPGPKAMNSGAKSVRSFQSAALPESVHSLAGRSANRPDCPLAARRCIRKVQERPSLCFSRPRTDFGQARRNAPMQPDHARFGPEGHGRTPSLKEEKGKRAFFKAGACGRPQQSPARATRGWPGPAP